MSLDNTVTYVSGLYPTPANNMLQRTAGTVAVPTLLGQTRVGGGFAAAAERGRCYDFRCQGLSLTFLGLHHVFVYRVSEETAPVRDDG
jgi:hypothetical protein